MGTSRIKKHQKAILAVLQSHEHSNGNAQSICFADTKKQQYQLALIGLDEKNAYYIWIRTHILLKEDGKIWIIENKTDYPIDEELEAQGVKKADIVLGLLPEKARIHSVYGNE